MTSICTNYTHIKAGLFDYIRTLRGSNIDNDILMAVNFFGHARSLTGGRASKKLHSLFEPVNRYERARRSPMSKVPAETRSNVFDPAIMYSPRGTLRSQSVGEIDSPNGVTTRDFTPALPRNVIITSAEIQNAACAQRPGIGIATEFSCFEFNRVGKCTVNEVRAIVIWRSHL